MNSESLKDVFDVVVMLTWSNWKTEPRSNRYHYATRLAKQVPVLFVQPKFMDPDVERTLRQPLMIESTDLPNLNIVHYDQDAGEEAAADLHFALQERGFARPLIWIYNARDFAPFLELIRETGNAVTLFHATENYFTDSETAPGLQQNIIQDLVRRTCSRVDVVVGVSELVTAAYKREIPSSALFRTVENGCDYAFAAAQTGKRIWQQGNGPVAIYQGGINSRVDFKLLHELVHRLPQWQFWFCGREDPRVVEWSILKTHPNVRYLGELSQTELANALFVATVGLIPFNQGRWIEESLPLKSFEYLSYGLPVVTVPIDALTRYPDLFACARTAAEFADEIQQAQGTRNDARLVDARKAAAEINSYDRKFAELEEIILDARQRRLKNRLPLNAVLLYDERYSHISTIFEHIDAFRKYSMHHFYFVPATGAWPVANDELERSIDLSLFDVVIVHYSVRLRFRDYFSEALAKQVERHNGLKILFIQDEYEDTEIAREWMERLRFGIVYTCVPEEGRDKIYPKHRFPSTTFLSTLTGYVPETGALDDFAMPLEDRPVHIGYRGRMLPYVYGKLGHEKYRIGIDVKKFAEARSLPSDIEVDDNKRIYGHDWYRFLGSARATLGTESGSSVFDFTGEVSQSVAAELRRKPDATFDEVQRKILHKYEGPVEMNQVSPKIFESIRLRTALILFEGKYSDVVKPDVHFIPLKKDYSNIDEVFRKLDDLEYLKSLTDRAYQDVIESGTYSYRRFVEGVDADIAAHHIAAPRCEIVAVPCFVRTQDGSARAVLPNNAYGFTLSTRILGGKLQREQVAEQLKDSSFAVQLPTRVEFVTVSAPNAAVVPASPSSLSYRSAQRLWHVVPARVRRRLSTKRYELLQRHKRNEGVDSLDYRIYRRVFRLLPARVRNKLVGL